MPLLAGGLPLDQTIDLSDGFPPVDGACVHAALEQRIHVKLAAAVGSVTQELKDAFQPAHQLVEEPVVVEVDLMDELVEVILVARAKIDERLDCLVRVCGDLLPLASLDGLDCVIDEHGEICDTVVDVRGLVDSD
jgi:hypothetical protein